MVDVGAVPGTSWEELEAQCRGAVLAGQFQSFVEWQWQGAGNPLDWRIESVQTADPSAQEAQFLALLNDARKDPPAYGRKIGVDLSTVKSSAALLEDSRLTFAAQGHSRDMAQKGYFGHQGADGSDPGVRMTRAGFAPLAWGESIAAGRADPAEALAQLILDRGVADLGHRRMLLAIGSPYDGLNSVGVGYATGGPYRAYWTVDGARGSANPPAPAPPPTPPSAPRTSPRPRWWPPWAPWPFDRFDHEAASLLAQENGRCRTVLRPECYLIGQMQLDQDELARFLAQEGRTWERDPEATAWEELVEYPGRLCYLSFGGQRQRPGGTKAYLGRILEQHHGSVAEHAVWGLCLTGLSRATAQEVLRHRHFSPSMLSTRFADMAEVGYVANRLVLHDPEALAVWTAACEFAAGAYEALDERLYRRVKAAHLFEVRGWPREDAADPARQDAEKLPPDQERYLRKLAREAARDVLPLCLETKLYLTVNARALRNFLELRCHKDAAWEARRVANLVYETVRPTAPALFQDYTKEMLPDGTFTLSTPHRKV